MGKTERKKTDSEEVEERSGIFLDIFRERISKMQSPMLLLFPPKPFERSKKAEESLSEKKNWEYSVLFPSVPVLQNRALKEDVEFLFRNEETQ